MLSATDLLDLEALGDGRFRSRHNLDNGTGVIFGGQMLALALAAAQREAPEWPAHSLSGFFLRGGIVAEPVELTVERISDGRRFASRRVLAKQSGRPAFDLLCSFHDPETGLRHEAPVERAARAPEDLLSLPELARSYPDRISSVSIRHYLRPFPVEMRLIDPERVIAGSASTVNRDFWFRVPSASGIERAADHQCLLALLSDFWLPSGAATLVQASHPQAPVRVASLNHSFWFHAPARTDSWLLYRTEMLWADHGRALARGQIYDSNYRLAATAMQEFLLRLG
jgi:acyl-CoA thioesterase II